MLVARLLELTLVSAYGMGYRSATDMHPDIKVITKDGASRLGIDLGGCLHMHELERCNAKGRFAIKGNAFYGRRDQIDAVLDLYREGIVPGGWGPQRGAILAYAGMGCVLFIQTVSMEHYCRTVT